MFILLPILPVYRGIAKGRYLDPPRPLHLLPLLPLDY
jgi:hypothetical protein